MTDRQFEQPSLSAFARCPVCGRSVREGFVCHPSELVGLEQRLAHGRNLLPDRRAPTVQGRQPVVGSDGVSFEPLYLVVRSLVGEWIEEYASVSPWDVQRLSWAESVYRDALQPTGELRGGVGAALAACEQRVRDRLGEVDPVVVFAHLVFLDQVGLLPGFHGIQTHGALREVVAEHYDVALSKEGVLASPFVVRRRVDRRKVYSVTPAFLCEWDLQVCESMDWDGADEGRGVPVVGDHRDHNLVVRAAKRALAGLGDVSWVSAPHVFYPELEDDTEAGGLGVARVGGRPVWGFDCAGFAQRGAGERDQLQYLGVVVDPGDSLVEVAWQVKRIREMSARGIIILYNRKQLYEFLDVVRDDSAVLETPLLQEVTPEEYRKCPNVSALHEDVIRSVPAFEGTVFVPRRRLLDQRAVGLASLFGVGADA